MRYEPSKLLKRLKLDERALDLMTPNMAINRSAIKAIADMGILPRETAENVALKVIKEYRAKAAELRAEGATKAEAIDEAANGGRKLAARVQSAVLHEQTQVIKRAYRGEFYEWLASTAETPREEHVANYGKIFQLGVGDDEGNDPGDLWGCQCGMRIITDDTPEEFNDRLQEAL
jgi:hypothetical protein